MALHLWMINAIAASAMTGGGQDPSMDLQFALPDRNRAVANYATHTSPLGSTASNGLAVDTVGKFGAVVGTSVGSSIAQCFTPGTLTLTVDNTKCSSPATIVDELTVTGQSLAKISSDPFVSFPVVSALPFDPFAAQKLRIQGGDGINPETTKLVSVRFVNAGVYEVLKWLQLQGFDYVATSQTIDPKITVTLNVENRPLKEVADTLALALGGHWERNGTMRIFKKGTSPFGSLSVPGEFNRVTPTRSPNLLPPAKALTVPKYESKTLVMPPDIAKTYRVEELRNADQYRALADQMRAMTKELQKRIGDLMKSRPDNKDEEAWSKWADKFNAEMDKSFGPDFQKRMEEFSKKMEKSFGPEFSKKFESKGFAVPELVLPPIPNTKVLEKRDRAIAPRISVGGATLSDPRALVSSLSKEQ
jgi:hypothetical protein